jgi:hypothetical protein
LTDPASNQGVLLRYQSASGTSAGLYLFASAGTGPERRNSYRVWQDATTVRIHENAGNVAPQSAGFAAANAAWQTHSYGVFYDPATGRLQVSRDGVLLGSWTDATPLTTGTHLALRTDRTRVSFDDVAISGIIKYYQIGGTRVALRKAGAVSYLLGNHPSTALRTGSGQHLSYHEQHRRQDQRTALLRLRRTAQR